MIGSDEGGALVVPKQDLSKARESPRDICRRNIPEGLGGTFQRDEEGPRPCHGSERDLIRRHKKSAVTTGSGLWPESPLYM